MYAKTILSVCNGKYNFMERPINNNPKYKEHLANCISFEDELRNLVDVSIFSIVEKHRSYVQFVTSIFINIL